VWQTARHRHRHRHTHHTLAKQACLARTEAPCRRTGQQGSLSCQQQRLKGMQGHSRSLRLAATLTRRPCTSAIHCQGTARRSRARRERCMHSMRLMGLLRREVAGNTPHKEA
jgi:hypothetical protein